MRIRIILPSFVLSLGLLGLLFGMSPIHSGASSQGQDEITAAQLAAAFEAQKQADAMLTRSESAEQRFKELSAKLQKTRAARVIVQLRVAFRPEGAMRQAAERLAQRASIRQTQDELLSGFHLRNPRSLKRYKYVPLLAFSVDAVGLEALRLSSKVSDIYEDEPIKAAQIQSPTVASIGASNVWTMGYTGQGKAIAILDSGVDKNHSSLSGKVVREACTSTDDLDFEISSLCPGGATEGDGSGLHCTVAGEEEECAHGTKVAGVAVGVAPGANLISIQVNSLFNDAAACGGAAPCVRTNPSDLIMGLQKVYDLYLGGEVSIASVNVSFASGSFPDNCDSGNLYKAKIDLLESVGIPTVVAAGNGGQANHISRPACTSSAISVGATGSEANPTADVMAPFSNGASFLSLLAPGYFTSAPIPGGDFSSVSGTSVAAAHVSGAWALIKQWRPNESVDAVFNRLNNSGVPITDPRNNNIPKSRIQVDAAFSCLQNVAADRWKGEYFDNPNLQGNPVMRRDDGGSFLNMNFGNGSPDSDCASNADNFSVRWTRTVPLTTNVHRFSVTADDGARLYVDGDKKLDFWNGPLGTYTVDVFLNGGNHQIILELREAGGAAYASLSWSTPCIENVSADRWKGEYFNTTQLDQQGASPLMVRDDGNGSINLDWGSGGPSSACMLGVDNFSARWTRTVNFAAGPYRFFVGGDDGVRLYVGGDLKLDKWQDQGYTVYTADVNLSAGNHVIKLEFYEHGGFARASVSWEPLLPPTPSNLAAIPVSTSQIDLSWTHDGSFANGFKIERSNGGGYSEIVTVGANVRSYSDFGLPHSTTHSYRVRAFNNVGNSGYSIVSSATTLTPPPPTPSFLVASAISPTQISLSWSGGMVAVVIRRLPRWAPV
jgi:subtilisin family serine protease